METRVTTLLNNAGLAHSLAEAVDMLNFVCLILSDADLPAEGHMMEEYDALETVLRELGVLVPERVLDLLPETCDEVTDDWILGTLKTLPFECGHVALAAQDHVEELRSPLKRLIRAARIHRAVALAAARSYDCRDSLARATVNGGAHERARVCLPVSVQREHPVRTHGSPLGCGPACCAAARCGQDGRAASSWHRTAGHDVVEQGAPAPPPAR